MSDRFDRLRSRLTPDRGDDERGQLGVFMVLVMGAIALVVVQAGGFATLQLYALALMLGSLALAIHGERTDSTPS